MAFCALFIVTFVLSIFLQDTFRYKITPNPTNKKIRQKLKASLPKTLSGPIYELGSGFGHMSFFFSQLYPTLEIQSFEKARIPYLFQRVWLLLKLKPQIKLKNEDFFQKDFKEAQLIFCYLYRAAMPKIAEKFKNECLAKTWLVSHTFAIDNLKPDHVLHADDIYKTPIYFYQKK